MRMYSVPESFWDVVPEIDQHEVRYSAYTLKSSQNPKIIISKKRKYLPYDVGPDVDCEFDDEGDRPDYASYILPYINTEPVHQENKISKSTEKKEEVELSLDYIYSTLREIKVSTIRKIIKESKNELLKIQKNHPSKESLSMSTPFFKTMFNPDQKFCIHMSIRETLNIPTHLFRDVQYIYTILAPEMAITIFKKIFNFKTKTHAVKKLVILELLNQSFYSDKAAKDIYTA